MAPPRRRGAPRGAQPIEVGRVPSWWLECTPHHVLDVEEAERKRRFDATMAFYYSQLAAADDAGILGPDGKPILGADGKPLAWHGSPWVGRGNNEGGFGLAGPGAPGGTNFKIQKDIKVDPTLFGINESDPDYQSYLTGAKLPPAFLEKMQEMLAAENMANNREQTEYGKYGRQAEQAAFQPSWAKMKLKTTANSAKVYMGQDSSETHYRRRLQGSADPIQELQASRPNKRMVRKTRKVRRPKKKTDSSSAAEASSKLDSFIDREPPKHTTSISTLGQESIIRPESNQKEHLDRTIRTGRRKDIPISPERPKADTVPIAVQVALAAQSQTHAELTRKPSMRPQNGHASKSTPSPPKNLSIADQVAMAASQKRAEPSGLSHTRPATKPAEPMQKPNWRTQNNYASQHSAAAPAPAKLSMADQVALAASQKRANAKPIESPSWNKNKYAANSTPAPSVPLKPVTPREQPAELKQSCQSNYSAYSDPAATASHKLLLAENDDGDNDSEYVEETVVLPEDEDNHHDEYIVEEIIEEYDEDDLTYEEMEITDSEDEDDEDLNDLQAILAARQAELALLEAGY